MLRRMCICKIKGGKVTEKKLYYEGSITLDKEIIEKAGLLPGEIVDVLNLNNGARISTYVIEGEKNSGVICMNGPAARFFEIGDEIIILAVAYLGEEELKNYKMKIIELGENNKVKSEK